MLKPGTIVDRYVVEERIGEGGMAAVYRVRHTTLGSRHALKVLTLTSEDVRQRLVQEGKVQASLHHPNIVAVSDVLDVNGSPGLVMEFIQGPALDHWLYNYSPSLEEALTVFRGVVAGVGAAHAKGVLHRDLKPANILLHVDERGVHPKVTDFGLAKITHNDDRRATRTGTTMGTPHYMAPEQIRDASSVDRRADLYSLGVILYELVCGERPYLDDDVIELFAKVAAGRYPHPREHHASLPQPVVDCIEGLLETNASHRLSDCASVLEVLDGADAAAFTTPFVLQSPDELPTARAMPAYPGPTSLTPDTPGAQMARRWLRELISVHPVERETSEFDDGDTSGLKIDLSTPLPPTPPAPVASPRRWLGTLTVAGLLALVGVLGLLVVGLAGLLFTSTLTGPTGGAVVQPAPPDPVPVPAPPVPAPPDPVPVVDPAPVQPVPVPAPVEPASPAPVVPRPANPVPVEPVAPVPVEPVAPVPTAPVEKTGSFTFTAGAPDTVYVVQLRDASGTRIYEPGERVPVGDYIPWARFAGQALAVAGTAVTVSDGPPLRLHCDARATKCVAK
ncbi:MAG: serine/threonine protein kinase [Alphaproteobacteria bacterium]|nr:serine/threonine protein kinase [Alphaproteobacteria bacterium]